LSKAENLKSRPKKAAPASQYIALRRTRSEPQTLIHAPFNSQAKGFSKRFSTAHGWPKDVEPIRTRNGSAIPMQRVSTQRRRKQTANQCAD
jgi:hypothetical protein